MISTKEIANYYLQSLRQSSLVEVNAKYTKPFSTNYSEIVEGKILSPTFPDFFKRTRKGLAKTESSNGLSVFIMPIVIKTAKVFIYPFIIPAMLNEDGQLTHQEYTVPWIQRELMTPAGEDSSHPLRYKPIANVNDYFDAINGGALDHLEWSDYIHQAEALFQHLTNLSFATFKSIEKVNNYVLPAEPTGICHIIPGEQNLGFSAQIQGLYQDILASKEQLPLFDSLNPESSVQDEKILSQASMRSHYSNHLAQMSPKHGMTDTQRNALANLDATTNGQTLAVSGPPGTGKTTLIQSVVATQWVQAAFKETMPPICVASSVNNQAVTNIIQSFQAGELNDEEVAAFSLPKKAIYQKMSVKKSTLISHWLPGHNTYGLYLAANRNLTDGTLPYAAISINHNEYFDQLITDDALSKATKVFFKIIMHFFRIQVAHFKNVVKRFMVI
ncbi:NB-ARC domain-containing protein [Lacticaseibacillus rhamnosus]